MARTVKKTAPKTSAKTKASSVSSVDKTSEISGFLSSVKLPERKGINELIGKYKPSKTIFLIILVVGLSLVITAKRGWFIAASVNNSPISTWELLSRMNKQYHTQVLNQMINEKLVLDEARKNKVAISGKEIDSQMAQLENNVGGAQVLDGLLSQQGQTRSGLKDQIKVQLLIEKLYGKEATVSAEEVTKFIEQNKDQLTATDSAGQITEATEALKQQKLTQIFQTKFQQLKSSAKIQIF